MKIILALLLIITSTLAFAEEFTVDGFSKDYYAKISLEDTDEGGYPGGRIAIFDRQNKELIKVEAERISGQIAANISVLPYGDQSVIMYEDFNFDGKKDFAIEDGESCYGLPAFNIYLADKNRFTYSEDFSRLAQDNCGMFEVNSKEKTISTMRKNGCCEHTYSDYIVKNNKPEAIKIYSEFLNGTSLSILNDKKGIRTLRESHDYPYSGSILTEEIWNGKKWIKTSKKTIDWKQEGVKIVFSFKIEKNDKQVVLFSAQDTILNYALVQKNGNVEFSYPLINIISPANPEATDFRLDTTQANYSVSFVNKNASYRIYENSDKKVGIKIEVNGKTSDWIGAEKTKEGSLEKLLNVKWDNVVLQ